LEYSQHSLILLLGLAVAGLTLVGAIAVGPYARRGLRPVLALTSFAAFLASGFWLVSYLNLLEQRRAIETRLGELRAQALAAGSTLACLERTGEAVDSACVQILFAAPETLAAANVYTAARFDLLTAAARFTGPRTGQFDDSIAALRRSLQQDPLGLTANLLVVREKCTAERCGALALFDAPARVRENIRQKTFDGHVARHAASWRTPAAATPAGPGAIAPTGAETRAPIPDKYTLPSAASIPPVSIMNEEPENRRAAKDRPPSPPAATATDQPATPTPQKQAPPRRESSRPSAPLSLSPTQ
jgi:hypothetical protein